MTLHFAEDQDYQAAQEAFENARFGEALELYIQVAERHPADAELKQQLGLCAFEYALQRMEADKSIPEDWRKAIRYLEEAHKSDGDNRIVHSLAVSHHNLGVYLNQREEYQEAQVQFEKALALKPGLEEASVSMAINYSDQGMMDRAEAILRDVIEKSPEYARAHHTLGLVLSAQGKEQEAVEHFKQTQSPERDIVSVYYNLGVSYCNQGQLDLAEEAFRQTLELNPEFVPALYNLGLILHQQGDLSAAEKCFEEVIRIEPDSPGGYFCLASLYERRDPGKAIPIWERYLELAANIPSEAETVAKVSHHLAELKKRAEGS